MQGVITSPFRGQFPAGAGGGGSGAWTPGGWTPVSLLAAAAFVYGQIGYLSADDTVRLAFSNGTEAQATAVCMCIDATIGIGNTGRFVFGGRVPGLTGGTFNTLSYLSTTAGLYTPVPNLNPGEFNTLIGFWLSTTTLQLNFQYPIAN